MTRLGDLTDRLDAAQRILDRKTRQEGRAVRLYDRTPDGARGSRVRAYLFEVADQRTAAERVVSDAADQVLAAAEARR